MSPEIALDAVRQLRPRSVVLDPMTGSGTVLRTAIESGHTAIGFDIDPLAVLIARVETHPIDPAQLRAAAARLLTAAQAACGPAPQLDWIDDDPETKRFVDFWFAPPQQDALRRIAASLPMQSHVLSDTLRIALSRTIVTKEHGASLGRDVSHSRPHRVATANGYEVYGGVRRAIEHIIRSSPLGDDSGTAAVFRGDARALTTVADESIDAIVTSPPYLNAIDYLRGHRLALVWLGYRLHELRSIRARSIGTERAADAQTIAAVDRCVLQAAGDIDRLPPRTRGMVVRYALDSARMLSEFARVLRSGGSLVLVVGNSTLRGVFIANSEVLLQTALQLGFSLQESRTRELPKSHRYLPPPQARAHANLTKRMATEVVLSLRAP